MKYENSIEKIEVNDARDVITIHVLRKPIIDSITINFTLTKDGNIIWN